MKNVSERLKIVSEINESTWEVKTTDRKEIEPGESGTIVRIVFPSIKLKNADH